MAAAGGARRRRLRAVAAASVQDSWPCVLVRHPSEGGPTARWRWWSLGLDDYSSHGFGQYDDETRVAPVSREPRWRRNDTIAPRTIGTIFVEIVLRSGSRTSRLRRRAMPGDIWNGGAVYARKSLQYQRGDFGVLGGSAIGQENDVLFARQRK